MGIVYLILILNLVTIVIAYATVIPGRFYHRLYRRRRRRYQPDYAPTMAVFIPCKGVNEHFEANIQTFLQAGYQHTKLFFLVESQQDAAFPILHRHTQRVPNAYVIVAGLAKSCGQKNHNLLQGIKASEEQDDVYVFLDGYSTFTAQQLRELVLPLSDPSVTVATGFRWNILNRRTLGERVHAFMIALQWSVMSCPFIHSVWGGATAIRREDFEKLGVREYWLKTVVDDMTLQQLLAQQGKRAVFVPACVKDTNNTVSTVSGAIQWFKRQALYLKFYLRPFWWLTLWLICYPTLNILTFPLVGLYTLLHPGRISLLLTGVIGASVVLTMLYCVLLKRPNTNDYHGTLTWFLWSPVYLACAACAYLLGLFTRVMRWRGIAYQLDYHGIVQQIVRTE
jgi:ceramide glucosyltransferase